MALRDAVHRFRSPCAVSAKPSSQVGGDLLHREHRTSGVDVCGTVARLVEEFASEVRERHLRSATAWEEMANRVARTDRMRAETETRKAAEAAQAMATAV